MRALLLAAAAAVVTGAVLCGCSGPETKTEVYNWDEYTEDHRAQ